MTTIKIKGFLCSFFILILLSVGGNAHAQNQATLFQDLKLSTKTYKAGEYFLKPVAIEGQVQYFLFSKSKQFGRNLITEEPTLLFIRKYEGRDARLLEGFNLDQSEFVRTINEDTEGFRLREYFVADENRLGI